MTSHLLREYIDKVGMLSEATLDFASVKVVRDENQFDFTMPIDDGGTIEIIARVHLARVIYIANITTKGVENRSDIFAPTNDSHPLGIRLGTAMTRRMLHFIMQRIQQDYPNAVKIAGFRITGTRSGDTGSMAVKPSP